MVKKPTHKTAVKIPAIEFRYSWPYDQENRLRFTDPLYPSREKITDYIQEASAAWRPRRRTLLNSIARVSGLPWREEMITCYVVGRGLPMSDPLTLPVYEGHVGLFQQRLVHELIQRTLMHEKNLKARSMFWEGMMRELSEDGVKVSYMVPANAIFSELHSRYFEPDDFVSRESLMSRNLDYRRAWEIVKELGPPIIIERFRRGKWD